MPETSPLPATTIPDARPRYPLVDMARGVAILLMFVYHFSWDLTFFGYAQFRLFEDPKWIWFARIIAGMILFVMGVAQVLARRRGVTSRSFLRRFGMIAAAAALVSAATFTVDPRTYIFFGILHHIAVASVILLFVIRLPTIMVLALALICLAAPTFLAGPALSVDWLLWLGLITVWPESVDYVPMLPWFGVPLLGVVTGRLIFKQGAVPALFDYQPVTLLPRLVYLCGRHSLLLYLIHQPILFGGLYIVSFLLGTLG